MKWNKGSVRVTDNTLFNSNDLRISYNLWNCVVGLSLQSKFKYSKVDFFSNGNVLELRYISKLMYIFFIILYFKKWALLMIH